jgi:hypothetical protein
MAILTFWVRGFLCAFLFASCSFLPRLGVAGKRHRWFTEVSWTVMPYNVRSHPCAHTSRLHLRASVIYRTGLTYTDSHVAEKVQDKSLYISGGTPSELLKDL